MTPRAHRREVLAGLVGLPFATQALAGTDFRGFDVIIRNGVMFDGLGGPGVGADVALTGGRITAVGDLAQARGRLELDARGMAVAPGFINMLSWANETLIEDGLSQSDIRQGVTLEVFGEGWSMGPYNSEMKAREQRAQSLFRYPIGWTSLAQYLGFLEDSGISTNVASFVGATTLRMHEVGYDDVRATPRQLRAMQRLLAAEMRDGALGVGSSLIYAPGNFADTDELVALAAVAGAHRGGYISHLRSEADRYLEAIDELIAIGRRGRAKVQMYHMKPAGQANWHKSGQGLARLQAARDSGLDVTANIYPYTAGATGLNAAMPLWVQEGGTEAWIARLGDPATRVRVIAEMRQPAVGWENLYHAAGGAEGVLVIGFKNPALRHLTGKRLSEVVAQRGTSPEDTIIDLVIEDQSRVDCAYFLMAEENIRRNIAWPWTMVGSDDYSLAPTGKFLEFNPHPRAYGTFARFLGKYVREEGVISLGDAIRRLTALPAHQLGLSGRGRLVPGFAADVVVFDPAAITDLATFANPHVYARGMHHVIVNGVPVLRDGDHTGARPGRFVKGPGWRG